MALEVDWFEKSFIDFTPPVVAGLQSSGVLDAVKAYANIQRAIQKASALILSDDLSTAINPQIEIINAVLDDLQNVTADIINTGMYLLIVPPGPGGLERMKRFVKTSLLNARDPRRPTFSQDATVFAIGGLAFALDLPGIQEAFTVITNVITNNVLQRRAADAEKLENLQGLAPSYFKNQLAGDAGPIEPSPWQSVRLSDQTPALQDILFKANSMLASLSNSVTVSTVDSYKNFADRQYLLAISLVQEVDAAIKVMTDSLEDFPIKIFGALPATGGLGALIDAVETEIYDVSQHPELEGITDNTLTAGFFYVGGGPDASLVTEQYNLVKGIYKLF